MKANYTKNIINTILNLLYPPRCSICDSMLKFGQHGCCTDCEKLLPCVRGSICMKCGKPVADERTEYCDDCKRQRHFFDQGVAAFTYTGALRASVHKMKSANRRDYLPFFAESMTQVLMMRLSSWRPELILPVPMHPKKQRRRGYNQSELLAVRIGDITGIPVEKTLLRCTKITPSQKELDRKERMKNLYNSFAVCEPFPKVSRVLLVDDVYTTGSTMDEVSRILKSQGVQHVFFAVLCTGKGKKAVCTDKNL